MQYMLFWCFEPPCFILYFVPGYSPGIFAGIAGDPRHSASFVFLGTPLVFTQWEMRTYIYCLYSTVETLHPLKCIRQQTCKQCCMFGILFLGCLHPDVRTKKPKHIGLSPLSFIVENIKNISKPCRKPTATFIIVSSMQHGDLKILTACTQALRFCWQEYLNKVHGYFEDCGKTLKEQLWLGCRWKWVVGSWIIFSRMLHSPNKFNMFKCRFEIVCPCVVLYRMRSQDCCWIAK